MTCRELADRLGELIDGELSADGKAAAEAHLARCPPCVALKETYRLTILIARRLPPLPLPPAVAERLEAALRQGPE